MVRPARQASQRQLVAASLGLTATLSVLGLPALYAWDQHTASDSLRQPGSRSDSDLLEPANPVEVEYVRGAPAIYDGGEKTARRLLLDTKESDVQALASAAINDMSLGFSATQKFRDPMGNDRENPRRAGMPALLWVTTYEHLDARLSPATTDAEVVQLGLETLAEYVRAAYIQAHALTPAPGTAFSPELAMHGEVMVARLTQLHARIYELLGQEEPPLRDSQSRERLGEVGTVPGHRHSLDLVTVAARLAASAADDETDPARADMLQETAAHLQARQESYALFGRLQGLRGGEPVHAGTAASELVGPLEMLEEPSAFSQSERLETLAFIIAALRTSARSDLGAMAEGAGPSPHGLLGEGQLGVMYDRVDRARASASGIVPAGMSQFVVHPLAPAQPASLPSNGPTAGR